MTKSATQWSKGTSGNPGGRPKIPDSVRELKDQAKVDAIEAIAQVMTMTRGQIEAAAVDMESNGALALAASVMKSAIKYGCAHRAGLMLSYIIGKPESMQLDDGDDQPVDQNKITLAYSAKDL